MMATFPSIRVEGGLLGPDLLDQLLTGDLPGQRPADFGLEARRNLTDEIAAAFADARALWGVFKNRVERLPEGAMATTATRDAWMVPFLGVLGYEPRYNARAYESDGLTYAISHRAGEAEDSPPIHIVGARQELGRVPPSGRPRLAPHSLVQEYLNRTEQVWGLVTNGLTLRLLRDCTFVRRLAYVEFDLAAMIEEQRFADFAAFYRLIHRSRLPRTIADSPTCLLEQYHARSVEQGGRVREHLRVGVEECIKRLGDGFLCHSANGELRRRVLAGADAADRIAPEDLYRQLLRLVYRFLFLLVSEDRGLLSDGPLYRDHYGIARFRRLVDLRPAYTDHDDLWQSLRVLWLVLTRDDPQPSLGGKPMASTLGLPVLNGELFAPVALDDCTISNRDLLGAFWNIAYYTERLERGRTGATRRVNYAALDVEELGSVYESLLDFHPAVSAPAGGRPVFDLVFGSDRKTTGSYYTPPELVAELIKSVLDPVIQDRLAAVPAADKAGREKAILAIRVCDPACGSGHFLLAAARRLGRELARTRTGEDEPSPERVREAIRDCVGHCIYGVDKNPLAVDLCRVALWLEGHAEGKPLTFLDHRIRCGDSLIGVFDLECLKQGIPDKAFEPREGDDKAAARAAARQNKAERAEGLFQANTGAALAELTRAARQVDAIEDESPEAIRRKRGLYESTHTDASWLRQKELCDLWAGAFFQRLDAESPAVTTGGLFDRAAGRPVDARILGAGRHTASAQRFFHWPLEFPEVFADGGFDVVLGNPPWDQVLFRDQEFFVSNRPDIARAPTGADRGVLIEALRLSDPPLYDEYLTAARASESTRSFVQGASRFPLTGRGRMNTFALFVELAVSLMAQRGRLGQIVPSGIATDDTTKLLFQHLTDGNLLLSLFDFENRAGLFPAVDSRAKFSLVCISGSSLPRGVAADYLFFAHRVVDLKDEHRHFRLTGEDVRLLNPNTRTAAVFRSKRDAELTKAIYGRLPVLLRESEGNAGPWGIVTRPGLFNMTGDSGIFKGRGWLVRQGFNLHGNVFVGDATRYLPLYEGKMFDFFDHRFASVIISETAALRQGQPEQLSEEDHEAPDRFPTPRYWVEESEVRRAAFRNWDRPWLLGWKEITSPTNERTLIPGLFPLVAIGHKIPLALPSSSHRHLAYCLLACLSSVVTDWITRQKLGTASLTPFTLKQIPVLKPDDFVHTARWAPGITLAEWLAPRVLELVYTAHDLAGFARDLGYDGPTFRWDPARRAHIRAELDAAFFHLYGVSRDDAAYILDTFTVFKARDEERNGGIYKTQETILAIYDEMAEAQRSGRAWVSSLDPPPADPRCAHTPAVAQGARPERPAPRPRLVAHEAERVFRPVRARWEDRYRLCVPRIDLKAAAGAFGEAQGPEFEEWVQINTTRALVKGMFVARVVGRSMEPMIPDGAYCLFQYKAPRVRDGLIGLFQLQEGADPESGGRFTVKRLRLEPAAAGGGERSVMLVPENPEFEPIRVEGEGVRMVAEFLEVLRPLEERSRGDT